MTASCALLPSLVVLLLATCIGCAPSTVAVQCKESPAPEAYAPATPAWQSNVANTPHRDSEDLTPAERFDCRIMRLAGQLEANLNRETAGDTFIVTGFTDISSPAETSALGRQISESLTCRLYEKGWKVFDTSPPKDAVAAEKGPLPPGREPSGSKESSRAGGIVTGTYVTAGRDVIINARVIDANSGEVLSAGQTRIPLDLFSETLLLDQSGAPAMKIIGNR